MSHLAAAYAIATERLGVGRAAVHAVEPNAAEHAFGPGGILVVIFVAFFAVACIGAGALLDHNVYIVREGPPIRRFTDVIAEGAGGDCDMGAKIGQSRERAGRQAAVRRASSVAVRRVSSVA